MILVHNDLTKDPTSRNFVHIEVHTQLHSATLVKRAFQLFVFVSAGFWEHWKSIKMLRFSQVLGKIRRFKKFSQSFGFIRGFQKACCIKKCLIRFDAFRQLVI